MLPVSSGANCCHLGRERPGGREGDRSLHAGLAETRPTVKMGGDDPGHEERSVQLWPRDKRKLDLNSETVPKI